MLIILSEELIKNNFLDDDREYSKSTSINNILDASRTGKHLIKASRKVYEFLGCYEGITKNNREYSKILCSRYTSMYFDEKSFKRKIIVVGYMDEIGFDVDEINNKQEYKMPLELFSNGDFLQECYIIGEGPYDAEFILRMTELMQKDLNYCNIKLNYQKILGGGDTTAEQFKQIACEKNNMCLVFADSDKDTPMQECKKTAKRILGIMGGTLSEKYILNYCREIENIIPSSLIMLIDKYIDNEISIILQQRKELSEHGFYYDYKNGLDIEKIDGSDEFWMSFVKNMPKELNITYSGYDGNLLKNVNDMIKEENIIKSKNIIEKSKNVDLISKHKKTVLIIESVYKTLSKELRSKWIEIIDIVIAWGCCGYRNMQF